ncbi:HD domain-containing protein [Alkalicoccus urumqiensis]|uniref:Phosphohydrolase n=1 Tax=Alkalicoccus urumqiensis TaxID=1548213 RepID=A0A2P6MD53_ALKUR|nr:HD domain-containing protein [Alkalicoccus urumqiensis]PRO64211.1 phosphohydrolase [Alkalicoccus urumqiensis]
MSRVTLQEIFQHPITQKYVGRSGMAHAVAVAYHAFKFAKLYGVHPDLACKAAFLHDIGHYTWYRNGHWDYELYKQNDIHAIKGAERAHKLLIRLGEHPAAAKQISLAVLFHTDSFLPDNSIEREALQQVVALADEADEEPGGGHHYKEIAPEEAESLLVELDRMIEKSAGQYQLAVTAGS